MKKCIEAQAKSSIQIKLLLNEIEPLKTTNVRLKTEIKELEYKLLKQELISYGIGALACIILFFITRRALQIKYKKEFQIDFLNSKTPHFSSKESFQSFPCSSDSKLKNNNDKSSLEYARQERRKKIINL